MIQLILCVLATPTALVLMIALALRIMPPNWRIKVFCKTLHFVDWYVTRRSMKRKRKALRHVYLGRHVSFRGVYGGDDRGGRYRVIDVDPRFHGFRLVMDAPDGTFARMPVLVFGDDFGWEAWFAGDDDVTAIEVCIDEELPTAVARYAA